LPSLKIREGAIDILLYIYKLIVPKLEDYLTESGYLNLKQFQTLIFHLALVEEAFFKNFIKNKEIDKRNSDIKEDIWEEFIKQRDLKLNGKIFNNVLFDNFYESIDAIKMNERNETNHINSNCSALNLLDEMNNEFINKQNVELFNKSLKLILQVLFK